MVQKSSSSGKTSENEFWKRVVIAFKTDDVQWIADELDISYQAVDKWQKGRALPSKVRLEEISQKTGRTIDWLLTGKENLTEDERVSSRFTNMGIKFGSMSPVKKARLEVLIETLEHEIERMETEPDE